MQALKALDANGCVNQDIIIQSKTFYLLIKTKDESTILAARLFHNHTDEHAVSLDHDGAPRKENAFRLQESRAFGVKYTRG